jgi:hypothetical protein
VNADEPTLGELGRQIEAVRRDVREDLESVKRDVRDDLAEFRAALGQLVLREVYSADKTALGERIARLEQEVKDVQRDRGEDRKASRTAMYSAAGALAVALVMFVLSMALKSKGAA